MQLKKYMPWLLCLGLGLLYARTEVRLHRVLLVDGGRVARLEAMIAQQREILSVGKCSEQEKFWAALLSQEVTAQDTQRQDAVRKSLERPQK